MGAKATKCARPTPACNAETHRDPENISNFPGLPYFFKFVPLLSVCFVII